MFALYKSLKQKIALIIPIRGFNSKDKKDESFELINNSEIFESSFEKIEKKGEVKKDDSWEIIGEKEESEEKKHIKSSNDMHGNGQFKEDSYEFVGHEDLKEEEEDSYEIIGHEDLKDFSEDSYEFVGHEDLKEDIRAY